MRDKLLECYNEQFGSIFRTHASRTLYFHDLGRFSDLYTSNVANMMGYPPYYQFMPRRQFYEHEPNYHMFESEIEVDS